MLYFHPTLSLKDERHRQILHDRFEDSLSVLKNGSCEHTTNDLLTFSSQKRNLGIGPSERLLPAVLEAKIGSLKTDRVNGSSELSVSIAEKKRVSS